MPLVPPDALATFPLLTVGPQGLISPVFPPIFSLTPSQAAFSRADAAMPRGFTAKQYIGLVAISFSSMMLGGSCVHAYYKPDLVRDCKARPSFFWIGPAQPRP